MSVSVFSTGSASIGDSGVYTCAALTMRPQGGTPFITERFIEILVEGMDAIIVVKPAYL